MDAEASTVPAAIATVAMPNTPFAITLLFIPKSIQVVLPLVLEQEMDLLAAELEVPAVKLIPVISEGE
jgi:hypothetical protein